MTKRKPRGLEKWNLEHPLVREGTVNLTAGTKGSNLTMRMDGLTRTAYTMAFTMGGFAESLDGLHKKKLADLAFQAKSNFESRLGRRKGEHGQRPGRRQTGKFTFGSRGGGAFVGLIIKDEKNFVSGFGYPNVAVADRRTKYVWRTLEYGLNPHADAVSGGEITRGGLRMATEVPIGKHLMPVRFTFTTSNPATSKLKPKHKEASDSVTYVRLFGKNGKAGRSIKGAKKITPGGIPPSFFISDAIAHVAATMPAGYREVMSRTWWRR